ncbi:glycerate 3-kinase [Maritalea myrionectae]|uniref:Glycerate 3-kinase n=1 Tax=Maritalea myrionectae TaxID=454601 RepID=A0A2R4MAV7_9HYPH|nr:kinase [Maritalea myrionectae]AVX03178.1 glycerate 3-kinase [Maritalea myrionectae]
MRKQDIKDRLIASYGRLMGENNCPLVGLAGGQGIGKSYLAQEVQGHFGEDVLVLSLDDFYLTKAARVKLADEVHPLFATRGVPGTHDVEMLRDVLGTLQRGEIAPGMRLPRFIKALDDRAPESDWHEVTRPPKLILLEGWCVGVAPQREPALQEPINGLEQDEDAAGVWRRAVNQHLLAHYYPLWQMMVHKLYLKPCAFSQIFDWRWQQEQENLAAVGRVATAEDQTRIARFIQYYERITRHMMQRADDFDMVVEVSGPDRAWQLIKS